MHWIESYLLWIVLSIFKRGKLPDYLVNTSMRQMNYKLYFFHWPYCWGRWRSNELRLCSNGSRKEYYPFWNRPPYNVFNKELDWFVAITQILEKVKPYSLISTHCRYMDHVLLLRQVTGVSLSLTNFSSHMKSMVSW